MSLFPIGGGPGGGLLAPIPENADGCRRGRRPLTGIVPLLVLNYAN